MKKLLIGFLFLGLSTLSHSCSMNNSFEQPKDIKILNRWTLETPSDSDNSKTLNCYESDINVKVSYVTDWDTFSFVCNNSNYKVRVIWIDTPETKHPNKDVECFWIEASNKMKGLLSWKEVKIIKWEWSWNTDKYWRLLRYVEINWEDIWLNLVKSWYAFSYKKYPHERLDVYNSAEKNARENSIGLWNSDTCNY